VLHEVEEGHLKQIEAARRLRLTDRQVRRLQQRLGKEGDRAIVHGLRGRRSNRKIAETLAQRALRQLRQARYAGFGPTLAAEHLASQGIEVSRETLRKWMSAAGLWQTRRRRVKQVHVWRPRRPAFGELVMMDSSPYRWLEDRGPASHLIAMIDDASSRVWGRLVEHGASGPHGTSDHPSSGMAPAGVCRATTSVLGCVVLRRKTNEGSTARTDFVSAAGICRWWPVRGRRDPQLLPAYGLQDSRIANQNPQQKQKPTTVPSRSSLAQALEADISTLR